MICLKHKWTEWKDIETDVIIRLSGEEYGYKRLGTKIERVRECTKCGKVQNDETASVWRDNEKVAQSISINKK